MLKLLLKLTLITLNILFAQKNELVIFHAGSFTFPIDKVIEEFKKENPNVQIKREIAGSLECARKITELNKSCDVFISSDYQVIDKLLIPKFAEWNLKFATNEIVIAYSNESKKSKEINQNNLWKILPDDKIRIGIADRNLDPCGYRTILTLQLAEKFYGVNNLSKNILQKSNLFVRPKETDLIGLLETGEVDYIFIYRSLAIQHKLNFIPLHEKINLSNPDLNNFYSQVNIELKGKNPTENILQKGEAIIYGLTIPNNSPNRILAEKFVKFILSEKGKMIIEKCGLKFINPIPSYNGNSYPTESKNNVIISNDKKIKK